MSRNLPSPACSRTTAGGSVSRAEKILTWRTQGGNTCGIIQKIQRGGGCPVLGVEGRVLRFPVLAALRRKMLVKPSGSNLIHTQAPPSETEGWGTCDLSRRCSC